MLDYSEIVLTVYTETVKSTKNFATTSAISGDKHDEDDQLQ